MGLQYMEKQLAYGLQLLSCRSSMSTFVPGMQKEEFSGNETSQYYKQVI